MSDTTDTPTGELDLFADADVHVIDAAALERLPSVIGEHAVVVPTFDQWWAEYPRKQGKAPARRRWAKMTMAERAAAWAALPAWVAYYATVEFQYVPHGSTWLNQCRWEDEVPEPRRTSQRRSNGPLDALRAMAQDRRSIGAGDA